MSQTKETFQSEVKEILQLMIHSLYSHREVFLRELISNASDAIDKLKFEALTHPEWGLNDSDLHIRIEPNPATKTLTISDNGIGMSLEEVRKYIGTIAHSGTKAWGDVASKLKENPDLIGQFGVGFYSSFMVADRIELITQKAGEDKAVRWESRAEEDSYTIEESTRNEGRGTTIVLHLKSFNEEEEEQDFTQTFTIENLVRKYSDFISYPIKMWVEEKKEDKTEKVDRTLNSQKALWERPSSEIKDEEYKEFYKHLTHDWSDPLKWIHFKAEGLTEFTSLLYIPGQKPFNFDFQEYNSGLQLFVRKVFILDNCEELLPKYLRFVKGMVDCPDLSLNVSREILQKDHQVERIRKALSNKILSTLADLLKKDRKSYLTFFEHFGSTLKEGLMDYAIKEKIQNLLLFHSTHSDEMTTLQEYVDRMKPDQKGIFTITAETLDQAKNSPYLEKVLSKEYEVLLLVDRIDDWAIGQIPTFADKPVQSLTSEEVDLETESEKIENEKKLKEAGEKLKPVIERLKSLLGDRVKDVRVSNRMKDSPVCLVSGQGDPSARMEKLMKQMGQAMPSSKRILELNPEHPVYQTLLNIPEDRQSDWAEILYDQALLNEGNPLTNPAEYSKRIARLMSDAGSQFGGKQ